MKLKSATVLLTTAGLLTGCFGPSPTAEGYCEQVDEFNTEFADFVSETSTTDISDMTDEELEDLLHDMGSETTAFVHRGVELLQYGVEVDPDAWTDEQRTQLGDAENYFGSDEARDTISLYFEALAGGLDSLLDNSNEAAFERLEEHGVTTDEFSADLDELYGCKVEVEL